jgi:hypothetical protein
MRAPPVGGMEADAYQDALQKVMGIGAHGQRRFG